MNKIIIVLIILLGIALINYLKIKKRRSKHNKEFKSCCDGDSDYDKVKTTPAINCIQCDNCVESNSGCCANCSASQQYISNNSDSHCHHHEHHHSHSRTLSKDILVVPMTLLLLIGWGVKKYLLWINNAVK